MGLPPTTLVAASSRASPAPPYEARRRESSRSLLAGQLERLDRRTTGCLSASRSRRSHQQSEAPTEHRERRVVIEADRATVRRTDVFARFHRPLLRLENGKLIMDVMTRDQDSINRVEPRAADNRIDAVHRRRREAAVPQLAWRPDPTNSSVERGRLARSRSGVTMKSGQSCTKCALADICCLSSRKAGACFRVEPGRAQKQAFSEKCFKPAPSGRDRRRRALGRFALTMARQGDSAAIGAAARP